MSNILDVPSSQFISFFPLNINGNIFSDPTLSDLQKTIIAIAQMQRLKIAYAKTEKEQQEFLTEINSSLFSRATGKHRDSIRRTINQMQKDENVQKYLSIFIMPRSAVHLNAEQIFRFTFRDVLPDQFSVRHENKVSMGKTNGGNTIDWHWWELVNFYLRDIKVLHGETYESLMDLINCPPAELVKGLLYLKNMLRRSEIKNPKGYLLSSFQNGSFKYKMHGFEFSKNAETKVFEDFLFKVPLKEMKLIEEAYKQNKSKFNFYYLTENEFALIQRITCAGRPRNIKTFLMREKIKYQVVAAVNYGK